LKAVFNLRLH